MSTVCEPCDGAGRSRAVVGFNGRIWVRVPNACLGSDRLRSLSSRGPASRTGAALVDELTAAVRDRSGRLPDGLPRVAQRAPTSPS